MALSAQQQLPKAAHFSILISVIHALLFTGVCLASIWRPDTFPDSLTEPARCGGADAIVDDQGGHSHDQQQQHPLLLVCDPDGLLKKAVAAPDGSDTTPAIRALNDVLVHIRNNTRCVCDDGQQQQQQPTANGGAGGDTNNNGKVPPPPFGRGIWIDQCEKAPNAHGFTVSVAVVEKMEVSDDQRRRYRSGALLPAIFAAELRKRLRRGQCNDDALIVLSVNDSAIQTSTGGVAATRLPSNFILNASEIARKFFTRRDFAGGLLHMVDQFGQKLGAPTLAVEPSWMDQHFWTYFPKAWRQSDLRWPLLVALLLLLILLISLLCWAIPRLIATLSKKNAQTEGYTAGRPAVVVTKPST